MQEKGSISLVQDKETAFAYGMPKNIIAGGYADEILSDTGIGDRILQILS